MVTYIRAAIQPRTMRAIFLPGGTRRDLCLYTPLRASQDGPFPLQKSRYAQNNGFPMAFHVGISRWLEPMRTMKVRQLPLQLGKT